MKSTLKVAKKLTRTPKHLSDLMAQTGLDEKTVKDAVRELRRMGVAVVSDKYGYHLWNGKDDSWKKFIDKQTKDFEGRKELVKAMTKASKGGLKDIKEAIEELA